MPNNVEIATYLASRRELSRERELIRCLDEISPQDEKDREVDRGFVEPVAWGALVAFLSIECFAVE